MATFLSEREQYRGCRQSNMNNSCGQIAGDEAARQQQSSPPPGHYWRSDSSTSGARPQPVAASELHQRQIGNRTTETLGSELCSAAPPGGIPMMMSTPIMQPGTASSASTSAAAAAEESRRAEVEYRRAPPFGGMVVEPGFSSGFGPPPPQTRGVGGVSGSALIASPSVPFPMWRSGGGGGGGGVANVNTAANNMTMSSSASVGHVSPPRGTAAVDFSAGELMQSRQQLNWTLLSNSSQQQLVSVHPSTISAATQLAIESSSSGSGGRAGNTVGHHHGSAASAPSGPDGMSRINAAPAVLGGMYPPSYPPTHPMYFLGKPSDQNHLQRQLPRPVTRGTTENALALPTSLGTSFALQFDKMHNFGSGGGGPPAARHVSLSPHSTTGSAQSHALPAVDTTRLAAAVSTASSSSAEWRSSTLLCGTGGTDSPIPQTATSDAVRQVNPEYSALFPHGAQFPIRPQNIPVSILPPSTSTQAPPDESLDHNRQSDVVDTGGSNTMPTDREMPTQTKKEITFGALAARKQHSIPPVPFGSLSVHSQCQRAAIARARFHKFSMLKFVASLIDVSSVFGRCWRPRSAGSSGPDGSAAASSLGGLDGAAGQQRLGGKRNSNAKRRPATGSSLCCSPSGDDIIEPLLSFGGRSAGGCSGMFLEDREADMDGDAEAESGASYKEDSLSYIQQCLGQYATAAGSSEGIIRQRASELPESVDEFLTALCAAAKVLVVEVLQEATASEVSERFGSDQNSRKRRACFGGTTLRRERESGECVTLEYRDGEQQQQPHQQSGSQSSSYFLQPRHIANGIRNMESKLKAANAASALKAAGPSATATDSAAAAKGRSGQPLRRSASRQ